MKTSEEKEPCAGEKMHPRHTDTHRHGRNCVHKQTRKKHQKTDWQNSALGTLHVCIISNGKRQQQPKNASEQTQHARALTHMLRISGSHRRRQRKRQRQRRRQRRPK